MLKLLKKVENGNQAFYMFNRDGQIIKASETDAHKLIISCPAEQRNCKIVNGHISMKPGFGDMITERQPNGKNSQKHIGGVRIYTKERDFNKCFIKSNDVWFANVMYDRKFIRQNLDVIREIDHAEVINWDTMMIQTPYGATDIDNLSTGLKTLLNIRYVLQKYPEKFLIINADECGDNILPYIFRDINNTYISIYIVHPLMSIPENYSIYLNDELLQDRYTFSSHIEYL